MEVGLIKPHWTKAHPTKVGWFWVIIGSDTAVVEIGKYELVRNEAVSGNITLSFDSINWWWPNPIMPPEFP